MTEVEAKRFAGPFEEPPFEHFIQSPIGLVPKDKGKKTRLIFHLSYPREGESESVNQCISHDDCTVKYPSFDEAVKLCLAAGNSCFAAKSDMARAFRNVPLKIVEFMLMLMKAEHPDTGKIYFFVDKCLPFGSSISCKILQDFSDCIAHLVTYRTGKKIVNYLDDYFFAALRKLMCDWQVRQFLELCSLINFPVSMEKTEWGSTTIIFLGLLLNTVSQTVSMPQDKIQKALDSLDYFLDRSHKKTTVLRAQQLCGIVCVPRVGLPPRPGPLTVSVNFSQRECFFQEWRHLLSSFCWHVINFNQSQLVDPLPGKQRKVKIFAS